jgi:glycosyltransferase involved in cell wall biosynthesis
VDTKVEPHSNAHGNAGAVQLSFVIPTKNEERMIGRSLEAIASLNFSRTQFEVIVVDNGSKDKTVAIAESFSSRMQLQVVLKPTGFVSAVRNAGARIARGSVVVFLDADCIVTPEWAKNALDVLGDPKVGAAGGPVLPESLHWIARAWFENDVLDEPRSVEYLGTAALAMRRDVFESIGCFDEALESNEDFELCLRTRRAGLLIRDYPQLAITHLRTPESLGQFFRRERWHGTHVFRVFLENLRSLANVRAVGFALFSLLCLAGIVVGLFVGVTRHSIFVLVVALAAYIAASLLLAMRMLKKHRSGFSLKLLAPLLLLHIVYGVARASALIRVSTWIRKQRPKQAPASPSA